mgnify:CR=1 FL=1
MRRYRLEEYTQYDKRNDEIKIVKTKKQHPCGSKLWEITRVGVDFKLKCLGCGHVIILPREKALKAITKKVED